MANETACLVVKDLCKQFASQAETLEVLESVNFSLQAGDNLSVIGPSGCGKSTLLYILGTLDRPTSGSLQLGGVDPFTLGPQELAEFRNRQLGFVFQDHLLLPQLTVVENVLLPALAAGAATQQSVQRAEHLIGEVGLGDRRGHLPGQLSGGEKQRVAVARALLNSPKLILADEPTGNLDSKSSEIVAKLLFELPQREQSILILVTHSDRMAERASIRMRLDSKRLVEV
jgi:lipoprotein-releasing system ATP-binding protein